MTGLILDSNVLIATERRRGSIRDITVRVRQDYGEIELAISAMSVVELTHGIYRAPTDAARQRRRIFVEDAFNDISVQPVTLEIAQLAGKIEGEQAAKGIGIPVGDLIIGATGLYLGFAVATFNIKHFQLIPNLSIVTL